MMHFTHSLILAAHLPWARGRLGKRDLLPALIASLALLLPRYAAAQIFTNLHNFGSSVTEGITPSSCLVLSDNILYGTAELGGAFSNGVVFAIHTDGTGYTNLHSFTAASTNSLGLYTNSDGTAPGAILVGRLVLSGNTLYGTTYSGGIFAEGTVFRVNTDGSGFTNLHNFAALTNSSFGPDINNDGAGPDQNLVLSGNTLYGTAIAGGSAGSGTVFKLNTDGSGFANLHTFTAGFYTNSDGNNPIGSLVLSGNTLYGEASGGGAYGSGTLFAIKSDGTGFTNLHVFTALSGALNTNSDGAGAVGGFVLCGNTLFGTTVEGGVYGTFPGNSSFGGGTVFKINTDGSGFTTLHSFTSASSNSFGFYTNSDGLAPYAEVIVSGNTLYGTASGGGNSGYGTVFTVNTDGTGFTTLYSFTAPSGAQYTNSDGAVPNAGLLLSANLLYGVTSLGGLYGTTNYGGLGAVFGSRGLGALFSITLPQPQLTIIHSGTNVVLTWPTNSTAFTLQATTNLASTNLWSNVSPASVVVNGQNTVTNPISSAGKFYRLAQ
jgi:uncharacterized repeat protein (TIGR03803 family)